MNQTIEERNLKWYLHIQLVDSKLGSGVKWQSLCNLLKVIIVFPTNTLCSQKTSNYDVFLASLFVISLAWQGRNKRLLCLPCVCYGFLHWWILWCWAVLELRLIFRIEAAPFIYGCIEYCSMAYESFSYEMLPVCFVCFVLFVDFFFFLSESLCIQNAALSSVSDLQLNVYDGD